MMLNWKMIFKAIGILLSFEIILLLASMAVSLYYHESVMPFVWPSVLATCLSAFFIYAGKDSGRSVSRRDGYIVVSTTWVVFSFIGMIPYLVDGALPNVASAFFETMSGFTSTGSTVMPDIDSKPHGILFWRSLTQWIGGIGIIFFTVAILPVIGEGEVKIFAAETTGPLHDKIHPRINVTARWIGTIYLMLTTGCTLCLYLCGIGGFDALNLSLTATGTGGFAPHSDLLHDVYHSPAVEYVLSFFMFCSGVNFTLLYWVIMKRRFIKLFQDNELRCYFIIVALSVIVSTITLQLHSKYSYDLERNFREALFTVISLQTTSGFASYDYVKWPFMLYPILLVCMVCGASSGSTSGGFKCVRISIIWHVIKNEFNNILHPHAVLPVKLNGRVISMSVRQTLLAFISLFIISILIGTIFLSFSGLHFNEALSISISCVSNVGPALGEFGPTQCWNILSDFDMWVCSILMLMGRLEIFPIFIIFTKHFWTRN